VESNDNEESPPVPGKVKDDDDEPEKTEGKSQAELDEQKHAAALKIQAGFKGISARKEVQRRKVFNVLNFRCCVIITRLYLN